MNPVLFFFRKGTEQFRWRYFSWKRMGVISILMLLFFIGWRFLVDGNTSEELSYPAILKLISKAILMGFIFSFQKPLPSDNEE